MFTKVTPQQAKHRSGYVVAVNNRESLLYEDSDIRAVVASDLTCPRIPIYTYDLRVTNRDGSPLAREISKVKRTAIIDAILAGMKFLGIDYEVWDKPEVVPEPKIHKRSDFKDPRFDK